MGLEVKFVPALREAYHRALPASAREPFGRFRRDVADRAVRFLASGPLPSRDLLRSVQMTGATAEYLRVGRRSAAAVVRELSREGFPAARPIRVLDFGCGLARTLRWLERTTSWRLEGCDVDRDSVAWTARAFPDIPVLRTSETPPLPWPDGAFQAIFAISVFTHFEASEQTAWGEELARILAPDGRLLVSTMGPRALGAFPNLSNPEHRATLQDRGFLFVPAEEDRFNSRGAFHTREGLARTTGPALSLIRWREGGLDGFQDLSVLRRSG